VVENMELLRSRGVGFVDPGSGYLACGWLGKGRLAEVSDIVEAAMRALARRKDLAGETIVVTAGPTIEDFDPVRFVSNRSSGKMGYRLAEAARDRGARVVLVSGPTWLGQPHGVEYVMVRSAQEMQAAVLAHAEAATVVAMAAAVSDYRPASAFAQKLKKADGALSVEMVRTPDILRSLGAAKGSRFLIGFAAETEDVLESARKKRLEKNADLLVANDVSSSGAVFGQEQSAAVLIDARGETAVPRGSKRALADRIWDRVLELKAARG
jgi:phosphopantothenoylcysteine decarboxylase/phosphopantothenate--cysteine ligase